MTGPELELDRFLVSVQSRALRVAEASLHSHSDALDAVQDAMLHLARAYGSRPCEEWGPLFHRILENKIRDQQRRSSVRAKIFFWQDPPHPDDEVVHLEELAPDLSQVEASHGLMVGEAMTRLKRALAALPTRQRQAFILRIWDGLSTDQTAAAMGCSDGSVKTHLSRALATLRTKLADVWGN